MSGIYLKGIDMSKDKPICIIIDPAGQARRYDLNNDKYADDELFEAVSVPPHGRLIDADALYKKFTRLEKEARNALKSITVGSVNWVKWSAILTERIGYKHDIADAPTIILAELPVHHGTFAATSKEEAIRCLTKEDKA